MYSLLVNNRRVAYWMVMLLVLSSGNSWFKVHGTYFYVIAASVLLFEFLLYPQLLRRYKRLWYYSALMLGIFFCQFFTFGWNTFPGIVNFISKLIFGGFIVIALDCKFKFWYLRVLYHLSIISLIFWSLQVFFGITFSLIDVGKTGKSILFYFVNNNGPLRNCGAFWEPGAFGCYLMFVPLLFINDIHILWKRYRKECIVLLLALLSTQSTTAFLSLGTFFLLWILFKIKSIVKFLYLIVTLFLFVYIYNNLSFLSEKIEHQTESAVMAKGEFNSTRMGTLLFDLHYIKKHPISGNGLHGKTRYAEHQYLIEKWAKEELPKGGNAFSDYLAKMGISFFICFFYFFFRTNRELNVYDKVVFMITFILLLMGEPLFGYPFALVLPFVKVKT